MISVGPLIATLTLLIASLLPARSLAALPPQATASATATCVSQTGPGIPPPAVNPTELPGFHAAWYGQSGYMRLCAGERATATLAYLNSGSRGWVSGRMGEVAYLGTWASEPGQDQPSILGGDGQRGSPATGWARATSRSCIKACSTSPRISTRTRAARGAPRRSCTSTSATARSGTAASRRGTATRS